MTPFFWKRCFLTWLKKWVLLTVFLKSCVFFFLKTLFYSVFSKAQLYKNKTVCWKNRKFTKNSGLFLNMAKWCFGGLLFWGFNVIVDSFWCVWHSSKSVKMLVFSNCFGFWGVAYFCLVGFGRFRCSCVSCVCSSFLCCFCFCFVALFLFCWIIFGVGSCSVFVFFVFRFFFGGFKGQVRWPFGPPHPCFLFLVFNRKILFSP